MPKVESIGGAVAGIFFLIMLYLFLFKGEETVKIIATIGTNAVSGIQALQGR